MAKHLKTGIRGEHLAVEYLEQNQYKILHRNWRKRHWEVDIIASKEEILHFIEVKTKTSNNHGFPEEAVTKRKFKYLVAAAAVYLFENAEWERVQFDILAITLTPQICYFLIEDVYL